MELEKNPKDKELINSAFRSMHTIKGGAGFLGLNVIVETAHLAEEVLGKLRSEELELTLEINDLLLESVDFLKHPLECYLRNEECSLDQELCENLKAISAGGKVQPKKRGKVHRRAFGGVWTLPP